MKIGVLRGTGVLGLREVLGKVLEVLGGPTQGAGGIWALLLGPISQGVNEYSCEDVGIWGAALVIGVPLGPLGEAGGVTGVPPSHHDPLLPLTAPPSLSHPSNTSFCICVSTISLTSSYSSSSFSSSSSSSFSFHLILQCKEMEEEMVVYNYFLG